jgi:cytochrome c-type biogenesis protein CcmH/NrfF
VSGHRRWLAPGCLALVLAAALFVGSGALRGASSGAGARIAGLERVVAAPPRGDLSVAQSNEPAAIEVRNQIVAEVTRGWSDERILDAIEAHYGTQILLVPPAGGLDTVLWAAPVALAVGAAAVMGTALVRRRRRT